ncbi:MAG: bacillithiol biosynthesis cysteine-adding enzyme BshC [Gemmatimonadaceae bacterium]
MSVPTEIPARSRSDRPAPVPAVVTEPLGGSQLARDVIAGAGVDSWYEPVPRSAVEWKARLERVRSGWIDAGGPQLIQGIRPALGLIDAAHSEGARRFDSVVNGGGVFVTTGQQPGLFGGPIYTWMKALSTLALANVLQKSTGIPVAPLFWAATDDADFEEARSTLVAVRGGVEVLRIADAPPEGTPMTDVPLGDLTSLLDALMRGAGSATSAHYLEVTREAYEPARKSGKERTVGSAFVHLLRAILEPMGIVVLDASHRSVRGTVLPIARKALMRAREIADALERRTTDIERAGYAAQVAELSDLSLVFARTDGRRQRVPVESASEMATACAGDGNPCDLSPNVLLRPVAERAIFGSAAYVGGPGEIAYFAQVQPVAEALGLATPAIVPRWSASIIEPHVARILERYGLDVDDLRDPHAVETRIAREEMPHGVRTSLASLREEIDRGVATLMQPDATDAPLLHARVIEGHRRALQHRLDRLERRYRAAVKRRLSDRLDDIATARGALFPRGMRQERALNLIPLLARHGKGLMSAMLACASEHAERVVNGGRRAHVATKDASANHR